MAPISEEHLYLLEEVKETFDNTHQYEGQLWDEVNEALINEAHPNIHQLLRDCRYRLDDTHCYETEIYRKLGEVV